MGLGETTDACGRADAGHVGVEVVRNALTNPEDTWSYGSVGFETGPAR